MELTEMKCSECNAEIGEWCFDMVARYSMPPYEYRKVYRGGALLTHPVRQRAIELKTKGDSNGNINQ